MSENDNARGLGAARGENPLLNRYEDWGLHVDFFKYPLTVQRVQFGSLVDEKG